MKKVLAGALIALASVFIYKSCSEDNEQTRILKENSMLIEKELKNVSKLIVSEGHFSEVYNYKDSRELFGTWLTAEKKALVVVNAEVTIGYDLRLLEYELDDENKILKLKTLPQSEIKINPDFEYYDVQSDYFNQFGAEDYNEIKDTVKASLLRKVKASSLVSNSENRLLSELSRIFAITQSRGWTLVYEGEEVEDADVLLNLGKTVID
ncbi:DUF4230 domain-containing protein [Flagellimonas meridianipacifica]|uniref:Uncharacterized protein DUF4230 n=1 Tax=Flagellimonas meridianipacifica TaxID=1080225 RepID=A0A2T0MES1_9FLAO|nr:DUF4230 domain-containing protein [Allomuricauda pacifica]PRX56062.1 uncharacterized protein DUF4230 [Allomuricauda pacifica]